MIFHGERHFFFKSNAAQTFQRQVINLLMRKIHKFGQKARIAARNQQPRVGRFFLQAHKSAANGAQVRFNGTGDDGIVGCLGQ